MRSPLRKDLRSGGSEGEEVGCFSIEGDIFEITRELELLSDEYRKSERDEASG